MHCAAFVETFARKRALRIRKGSFTGADRRRLGKFEQAQGGTIFLDEIGEIALTTQIKLLAVLQDRAFPAGRQQRDRNVDVRTIAATNRDLEEAVAEGLRARRICWMSASELSNTG